MCNDIFSAGALQWTSVFNYIINEWARVFCFFQGRAAFCSVRVVLADENDNAPRFRAVEYRMSIKANVAKGSLVTQIQAADPDAGSNGRITYSLYSEARLSLVDVLEVSVLWLQRFNGICANLLHV